MHYTPWRIIASCALYAIRFAVAAPTFRSTTSYWIDFLSVVSWEFKKAQVTNAIEDGVEEELAVDATIESDKDTFDSDNVSDSDDVDI